MTETTDAATGKTTATYTVTEGINTLQVVYKHRQLYKVQAQVDNYKTYPSPWSLTIRSLPKTSIRQIKTAEKEW